MMTNICDVISMMWPSAGLQISIANAPEILQSCTKPSIWYHWWTRESLQWHHNGRGDISNHKPHDCLLNCSFRPKSKKTSKLHVTSLCVGNSPVTGEFPAQRASNAENVSTWWRHHGYWEVTCHVAGNKLWRFSSSSADRQLTAAAYSRQKLFLNLKFTQVRNKLGTISLEKQ